MQLRQSGDQPLQPIAAPELQLHTERGLVFPEDSPCSGFDFQKRRNIASVPESGIQARKLGGTPLDRQ